MRKLLFFLCLFLSPLVSYAATPIQCVYPIPTQENIDPTIPIGPIKAFYATAYVPEAEELIDVQVPVPRSCRILNTKGNCVWCSMEVAARYAEITSLYDITKNPSQGGDPRCQGGSTPQPVKEFLESKHIRYDMITFDSNRQTSIDFFTQHCQVERRPVCFAIPGHMLTLCHFDAKNKIIKVIDNADRTLSVQQWPWDKFWKLYQNWAYVIYGDPDIIPYKYNPWQFIGVVDGDAGQAFSPPSGYFPVPPIKKY